MSQQLDLKRPATPQAAPKTLNYMSPQKRQAIGIGALLFCLLIGGAIVYWFLFGATPSRQEVNIDVNAPDTMRDRQGPVPRILKVNATNWTVNGDAGVMVVVKAANGEYKFSLGFQRGVLGVDKQQRALVAGRYRIIQDPAMAKAWNITPDQLAKLKKIDIGSGGGLLKPSSEDLAAIKKLWGDFESATDPATAQHNLIAKLDDIAHANADATKKLVQDRIEQIRQVLTPQQIDKITK